MHNALGRRVGFSSRLSGPRLGLTVGLVAAGVSGLLSLPVQAQQVPASVVFLVDNNESMQDYPQYLPEAFTPGYYPTPTSPKPGDLGGEGSAGLAINTGCSDPALVSAMSWFDKSSPDTAKNGAIPYDSDVDLKSPFFDPNRFYFSRGRRLAWNVKEGPYSINGSDFEGPLNSYADTLTACYGGVGWDTTDYPYTGTASGNSPLINECMTCLASKGWWRGPIVTSKSRPGQAGPNPELGEPPLPPEAFRKWIISGRVLNVRPPKFVVARKALKEVIRTAPHTRMGVATFGEDHGWFDPALMLEPLRPSCADSFPEINEAELNRGRLTQAVNEVNFRNNERSIGEALFSLGGYFSSQKADLRWQNWFKQPLNPGYFGWPGCCNGGTYDDPYTGKPGAFWGVDANEWLKAPYSDPGTGKYLPGQPWEETTPGGRRSVCLESQASAVIVVTGGTPRSDNTVPITKMMNILTANGARHPDGSLLMFDPSHPETNLNVGGVNYCDRVGSTQAACDYTDYNWPAGLGVGNKNFMDDVAFFLANTDLRGDMPGKQTVRTFVVGYGDSSPMLKSIALAGKGSFFRADQPDALRDLVLFSVGQSHANSCSAP